MWVRPGETAIVQRVNPWRPIISASIGFTGGCSADDRAIRSVREQCVEVAALPQLRLFIQLELGLRGQEFLGVELAAPVLDPDVVDLVEHLATIGAQLDLR